jgi:hypothetical protein
MRSTPLNNKQLPDAASWQRALPEYKHLRLEEMGARINHQGLRMTLNPLPKGKEGTGFWLVAPRDDVKSELAK